jgi:uncharacterized protein (DUF433 family)
VLAGVGHEVDVSLADMIADLRAATPTHAAQLLWPERRELAQSVDGYEIELYKWRERYFSALELRVRGLEKGLAWLAPGQRLERMLDRVASAAQRLERGLETVFMRRSALVERNAERLARSFGSREVERAAQGVETRRAHGQAFGVAREGEPRVHAFADSVGQIVQVKAGEMPGEIVHAGAAIKLLQAGVRVLRERSGFGGIERRRGVLGGRPAVSGTRITPAAIRRMVKDGWSVDRILEEFPDLRAEDVKVALARAG